MNKKSIQAMLVLPVVIVTFGIVSVMAFQAVRHLLVQQNEALVHSVAQSILPVLLVNDTQQVERMMKALESYVGVETAELISTEGAVIATFARGGLPADVVLPTFALASALDDPDLLHVMAPISFDTLILANLHIAVNLWPMYLRLMTWLGVLLIVPTVLYVLVKQRRIKVRFEQGAVSADAGHGDGEPSFDVYSATSQAMADANISLEYQPIRRMSDAGLFGMEVVACWRHPSGQNMHFSPADFTRLADQTGISLPFAEWLLRSACNKAAEWQRQYGPLILAIDVSGTQFKDPLFPQMVRDICDQSQYPYQLLELEARESIFAHEPLEALSALQAFVSNGLSVTVEGFGLMQSSLELLSSKRIHKVKLDGKLTTQMLNDDHVASLIQSTITHALACEVQVMSEQIASSQQHAELQRMGSIFGQGAFFEAPLTEESFQVLLMQRQFELPKNQTSQPNLLPL